MSRAARVLAACPSWSARPGHGCSALTAELADHWNGGLRTIDEVPALLAALDDACRDVGRDPATMTRSVEVLVRLGTMGAAAPTDDERLITGDADAIAAALSAFGDVGIDHLQVKLRPNALAGVEAFAPVIERMR